MHEDGNRLPAREPVSMYGADAGVSRLHGTVRSILVALPAQSALLAPCYTDTVGSQPYCVDLGVTICSTAHPLDVMAPPRHRGFYGRVRDLHGRTIDVSVATALFGR